MSSLVSNLMHLLNISLQLKDSLCQFVVERFKLGAGKMQHVVHLWVFPEGKCLFSIFETLPLFK